MFNDYKIKCEKSEVKTGKPYIWEDDKVQILNFPTKRHWKQKSHLEDVEEGLKFLVENYAQMGIYSLALPPLGCGLGGLKWADVKNLINKHLGPTEDLDVYVYEKIESKLLPEDNYPEMSSTYREDEGLVTQRSIKEGYFDLVKVSAEEQWIKFSIKGNPDFIHMSPNGFNKFTIHPILEEIKDGLIVYTAYWIKHDDKDESELEEILIEAVLRD
jgi:hypothetical protein